MLSLLLLCVVVFQNTGAIPAPGHGALLGYCDTSAHCQPDECCVSFNQPRGKRYVPDPLNPDLMRFVHGSCKKRGNSTANSYCIVNGGLQTGTDGLFYKCPCMNGFTCKGTGMHEVPLGEIGTCTATVRSASGGACNSGLDCADDECCVTSNRPIGRRGNNKRFFMQSHCQPMGSTGSSCYVSQSSGKPNSTTYKCPCSSGLTCHGSGFIEVPLGEVGKCGA